jgi:non-ribosomal peptide synthase protein (TIGR01720 family)
VASESKSNRLEQFPLSQLQQRIWAAESHGVSGAIRSVQLCLEIWGPLNINALQCSLNWLLARHPILRVQVGLQEETPVQHVRTTTALPLPVIDLSHRTGEDLLVDANRRLQTWLRERFDLRRDMLFRARLIRLAPERYRLHLIANLFVCDQESLQIVAEEIVNNYREAVEGGSGPAHVSELIPPEFAARNGEAGFNEAHRTERVAYWTRELSQDAYSKSGVSGNPDLRKLSRCEALKTTIEAPILEQLRTIAQNWNVALPEMALTIFAAALGRHLRQSKVVLSVSIAVDRQYEIEPQIGPIADPIPILLKINLPESIRDGCYQVKRAYENGLSRVPLPFEAVAAVKNGQDFRFDPLTSALFSFQVFRRFDQTAGGIRFERVDDVPRFGRFDIEYRVCEGDGGIMLTAIYKHDVYDAGFVETLLESSRQMLVAAAAGGDISFADVLPHADDGADRTEAASGRYEEALPTANEQAICEANEREFAEMWTELLPGRQIGIDDNFFSLGGDSILSVMLATKARKRGLIISPRQVFRHQTIRDLASVAVREARFTQTAGRKAAPEQAELTPIQHWWLQRRQPDLFRLSQSIRLDTNPDLDAGIITTSVRIMQSHHEALRLRLVHHEGRWRQTIVGAEVKDCEHLDLSGLSPDQQEVAIQAAKARLQSSLDPERGPVMNAVWFDRGKQAAGQLFLIIHHFAVDAVSWRILLEDLETACHELLKRKSPTLLPVGTSYLQWSALLSEHANSAAIQSERSYWLQVLDVPPKIPLDFNHGPNTPDSARRVSAVFDTYTTLLFLQRSSQILPSWIQYALMASIGRVLREWAGGDEIRIDAEGHGRYDIVPDVDVTRTVGWFTTLYPVRLRAVSGEWRQHAVLDMYEQQRLLPNQGIGYGLLRFLGQGKNGFPILDRAKDSDACFNYLGQVDHMRRQDALLMPVETGTEGDGSAERLYILQIDALISGGELRVDWEYSENLHKAETIHHLAELFRRYLLELIETSAGHAGQLHPALASLDANQLEEVAASLESSGEPVVHAENMRAADGSESN